MKIDSILTPSFLKYFYLRTVIQLYLNIYFTEKSKSLASTLKLIKHLCINGQSHNSWLNRIIFRLSLLKE